MMTIYLSVDYGKKRIGLAYCDAGEQFCFGLPTLNRHKMSPQEAARAVLEIAREKRAEEIVLGLPCNMDGSQGFMADRVHAFKGFLREASPQTPVHYMDERLTSKLAERHLVQAGLSPSRNKALIDEEAARQLLEDFLRRKRYNTQ